MHMCTTDEHVSTQVTRYHVSHKLHEVACHNFVAWIVVILFLLIMYLNMSICQVAKLPRLFF